MRFVVALAMVLLLLGMPLGCVFAAPLHLCCPKSGANTKCPYDTIDSAKLARVVATASLPPKNGIFVEFSARFTPILACKNRDNLSILHQILRI